MKLKEKNEARKLRKEKGLSIIEIAKQLNVAKSSVSNWVRDIELTEEQQKILLDRNPCHNPDLNGMKQKHLKIRLEYQKQGKKEALKWKNDPLHMAGCMLYWAEGSKGKNEVEFTNSDSHMMLLFKQFIDKFYQVPDDKINIQISCHNIDEVFKIEKFWLSFLNLPKKCLGKTIIYNTSRHNTGKKTNKLKNGICKLRIYNTEIKQRIFGSIQYYGNFEKEEWK